MYYGESGRGLMLLESPEGEIRTVEIGPRALCYVPPYWIHRSVNTGPDELVMTFAYPADSGQDYAIIEEAGGMKSRVVDDGKAAGCWWTTPAIAGVPPRASHASSPPSLEPVDDWA